jgi:hypothetical protein
MRTDDAVAMAETQVGLVLDRGGVMTMRRLSQVAADWSEDDRDHAMIMAGLWSDLDA